MRRIKNFLLTTLIGGLVVLLPIAILIFLFKFIMQIVGAVLEPLTGLIDLQIADFWINAMAFAGVVLFCFLVGLGVRTRLGKSVFGYIEQQLLERVPSYSTIRDIVQQFTGAKKMPFKQVVLIDPFNSGTRMTGFITDDNEADWLTVFVPTAPNPTNGYIFHARREDLEFLDVKTEEAMRTVVGMGVGSLTFVKDEDKTDV